MTTQVDSSSPFIGSTPNVPEAPGNPDKFLIRTMHADLLGLQGKAVPAKDTKDVPVFTAPEKILSQQPLPAEPKQFNPAEISSQVVRPFVEKAAEPGKKEIVEVPFSAKSADVENVYRKKNTAYRFFLAVIIVLAISIIGLGGYYFWITRAPQQPTVVEKPSETPVVITIPTEKYSQEKPNYLILDPATLSSDAIKKKISDTAAELKDKPNSLPYEFVVVDSNNNPVAFPIFATAAKLNLSSAILSDLGENFSLFLYDDNGNVRLAVAAEIAKGATLATELATQEKTFAADAAFLFLDAQPETTSGTFKNNTENSAIRYVNLNSQQTLSVDYAVINNSLIIATSKNTMQAVLDKLATAAASSQASAASGAITPAQ